MKKVTRRTFLTTTAFSLAAVSSGLGQAGQPADIVYVNGTFATLDPRRPSATALACRDESIVAIGSESDVAPFRGAGTRVIDLQGRTVIPGLNDSHMHFVRGGLSYNLDVRWDGVPSVAIALEKLKEQASRTPPGQWVRVGGGWSEFQFAERRMPTLDELNAAVPDVPAYVLYFYDKAMINKAGLKALGFDTNTKPLGGGIVQKDSRGDPTGLLEAQPLPATILAPEGKMPPLSPSDARNSIQQFMRELNRLGMTSVVDPGGVGQPYPQMYESLTGLARDKLLTMRVAMYLLPQDQGNELGDFKNWMKTVKVGGADRWFRFVGGGELLLQDSQDWDLYTKPPVTISRYLQGQYEAVISELARNGWSFRQHGTFDASISLYLDALEAASKSQPLTDIRWTLDHAELISETNLKRIASMGGGIAVQHRAAFHGELGRQVFGDAALVNTPPVRRMIELGIPVGAGTDATRDTSYNPWVCLQWLVTGKTVGGLQITAPDQCLDLTAALGIYTKGSAWFSGEENVKGTLSVGQLADFAVLSQDVFRADPADLPKTVSLLTVVGGKPVYAAAEFAPLAPAAAPVTPEWSPNAGGKGGYYRS